MPIYEYQCRACSHKMEAFQKVSEVALMDCPACHKQQLQKLVSAAGFQLKGGGWYATDYSGKESQKDKKSTAGEGGKSDGEEKKKDSSSSSTEST